MISHVLALGTGWIITAVIGLVLLATSLTLFLVALYRNRRTLTMKVLRAITGRHADQALIASLEGELWGGIRISGDFEIVPCRTNPNRLARHED